SRLRFVVIWPHIIEVATEIITRTRILRSSSILEELHRFSAIHQSLRLGMVELRPRRSHPCRNQRTLRPVRHLRVTPETLKVADIVELIEDFLLRRPRIKCTVAATLTDPLRCLRQHCIGHWRLELIGLAPGHLNNAITAGVPKPHPGHIMRIPKERCRSITVTEEPFRDIAELVESTAIVGQIIELNPGMTDGSPHN